MTPEQEEGEPEHVGDGASFETQGRPLSISYTLFWINEVYVSCLRMSYYMHQYLLRTYLMHYQSCLEHYSIVEYAC